MPMPPDYDEFRRTTWEERLAIFNALSPEGKAVLVRSQISGWLDRHREELTAAQIAILEESIESVVPGLYISPETDHLTARARDIEKRARDLLSPAQCIDALTMQWGMT